MVNEIENMSSKNAKELDDALKKTAASQLPDMVIIAALLEHQVDLVSKLNRILLDTVDIGTLPEGTKELVDQLDNFLEHSSVLFDQLKTSPLEASKIPLAIENKERTRVVQERYIRSKIKAGLI